MWHHTASKTDPANDARYMCHVSAVKPVANLLVARDGVVWLLAAGCTNTNGKGQAQSFSRGTVAASTMNSYAVGIELANTGVGETFPVAQLNSAFVASNAINRRAGNRPTDVCTHQLYAPDRKVDPAGPCAGSWQPHTCTASGSWNCADVKAECAARAGAPPPPIEPGDDDMRHVTAEGRAPMLTGPGFRHYARSQDEMNVMEMMHGPAQELPANVYDLYAHIVTDNDPWGGDDPG